MKYLYLSVGSLLFVGCSPITSSQHDEKYKWELTIHEVQTNLDELRHDTHCVSAELQIIDGRLKAFENALQAIKHQDLQSQGGKLELLVNQVQTIEKKWLAFEKKVETGIEGVENLSSFAKETSFALAQFKSRLEELESEIIQQNRRLETVAKLKSHIESLSKSLKIEPSKMHKVRPGETLEKIAKIHRTDVSSLKQMNQLQNDLIVVDQELKIP